MASESSSLSQSSLSTIDEFQGLEIQEFDANALWELLSDEPGEVVENGGEAPMQAIEVVAGPKPESEVESFRGCFQGINDDEFNWLHIMEETRTHPAMTWEGGMEGHAWKT